MSTHPRDHRRRFLRQCVGTTAAGLGFFAAPRSLDLFNLALVSDGVAAPNEDFRALVCIFLFGGMDSMHMIVPRSGSAYTDYQSSRADLALPASSLLPIQPRNAQGVDWGLHAEMGGLQSLFNSGKAALVASCGGLMVPTSKSDYQNKRVPLPPQLFSHNDQQDFWATLSDGTSLKQGWGGRMAEMVHAGNTGALLPMSFSVGSNSPFLTGVASQAMSVGTSGPEGFEGDWDSKLQAAFEDVIAMGQPTPLQRTANQLHSSAFDNSALLSTILKANPAPATVFPSTGIGRQLRMVSRLIRSRAALGMKRQMYFCSLGGFDTHDDQVYDLARLFGELSNALKAFHDACVELNVIDNVTAFTASDFGRTLTSNGDGTDHGWGNHHIVMGGAVKGGDIYGNMPILRRDISPDFVGGSNTMLPSQSVDQYGATLARWYGLNASQIATVFPRLSNFGTGDLGFMQRNQMLSTPHRPIG